jgi:predicted acyl esterase
MPNKRGSPSDGAVPAAPAAKKANSTTPTTLWLRHGGLLSTEKPNMNVVTKADWAHVKTVHAETQYFHSDFAHTDYRVAPGASASWSSLPLEQACVLRGLKIMVTLWVSTSTASTDFTASLSRSSSGDFHRAGPNRATRPISALTATRPISDP